MIPDAKCSNCRFFRKNEERYAYRHSCCRTSPVTIAVVSSHFENGSLKAPRITTAVETHWPTIKSDDWCGEFQAMQTKGETP